MKRKVTVLVLVPTLVLAISIGGQAADRLYPKVENQPSAGGKVFPKVELSVTAHSKSEALAISRRIQVDIGKVEAELAREGQGQAAGRQGGRKNTPAVGGRPAKAGSAPGRSAGFAESLLRETGKLSRLYGKEGLKEGAAKYADPMQNDSKRLHRLALDLGKSSGMPGTARIIAEMKTVLGRLKTHASSHERWVQALKVGTGAQLVGKPVPANMKIRPAPGTVPNQGDAMTGPQGQTGTDVFPKVETGVVFPKVEMGGGETGYEGVDGESIPGN